MAQHSRFLRIEQNGEAAKRVFQVMHAPVRGLLLTIELSVQMPLARVNIDAGADRLLAPVATWGPWSDLNLADGGVMAVL